MKKIKIEGKKVFINQKEGILYGGEFQYFRIPKIYWDSSIKYLKEAELNFISFYIPWIWHEYQEGEFDFTGKTLPERDLLYLFSLFEKYDINVIVRPGPYIYAEYQGFGIPEWLREKQPEIKIVYEDGTKSHEVCANHDLFLSYTEKWYKKIFEIIKPYFDSDMIFGCQIDNESGLAQFGNAPFMSDFNPDTIEKFKAYLIKKFAVIEKYNDLIQGAKKGFYEILPPMKGSSNKLEFRIYAEFMEDYLYDYIVKLKTMIDNIGIDTFFYLNDPYLCQWPHNSIKKSPIAPVGYDVYPKFTTANTTQDLPFTISYISEYFNSIMKDKLTIGAEVGTGWFDPRVQIAPEATLQLGMNIIARNTKMLAYYILQDCVEEDGTQWIFKAPIDVEGNTTKRYEFVKKIGEFINKYSNLVCESKEVYNSVGIAVYTFPSLDFVRANINFRNVVEESNKGMLHFNGASSMMGVLVESGYNPHVFNLEMASIQEMKKLKTIIIFSIGYVDRKTYAKLLDYVYSGGTLIAVGYPIKEFEDGSLIEDNLLFPAVQHLSDNIYEFGNANFVSLLSYDMASYQIYRNQIKHKHSLNTIDMMQPMAEATKYVAKFGTWLDDGKGKKVWGSRFVSTWKTRHGVHPLLRYNKDSVVAYQVRHGHGKSIFIGTMLGIFFDTPSYYTEEVSKRNSVSDFMTSILKESGVKPLHDKINDIEIIFRELDHSLLVFLINRGDKKSITLNYDFHLYESFETLFKGKESDFKTRFFEKNNILKGTIDKDDVVVLHFQ